MTDPAYWGGFVPTLAQFVLCEQQSDSSFKEVHTITRLFLADKLWFLRQTEFDAASHTQSNAPSSHMDDFFP